MLKTEHVYDVSPLYEYVLCDGDKFYLRENNNILFSVKNIELAAIFEIGRKMAQNKICF